MGTVLAPARWGPPGKASHRPGRSIRANPANSSISTHAVDLRTHQDAANPVANGEGSAYGSRIGGRSAEVLKGLGSSTLETGGRAKPPSLMLFGHETDRLAHIP
jgi:hypothetical protein